MNKFLATEVDWVLTEEKLKKISIPMPNIDTKYPSREEFLIVDKVTIETAKNILSVMDSIIENNALPNLLK